MNINQMILNLLQDIMAKDFRRKIWQLEFLLQYIMENPESINNLSKNVYPRVAEKFSSSPASVEKNISRLIPYISREKLSEIAAKEIDIETLTPAKLIDILIIYLKNNSY